MEDSDKNYNDLLVIKELYTAWPLDMTQITEPGRMARNKVIVNFESYNKSALAFGLQNFPRSNIKY